MFKKKIALLLAMTLCVGAFAGCGKKSSGDKVDGPKQIGVFIYNFNDTYLSTVRNEMDKLDKADDSIQFNYFDAQDDQGKQNDSIDAQIKKQDVFLVNLKDTGAADSVLSKLKETGKPVVLFNREPTDINAYKAYDKAKFVGTRITEAGILQGELIADYWKKSNGKADRNGNGTLDYVLLHGGLDNAEAVARSEESVKAIEKAGIKVNKIAETIALWDTSKAKDAMDPWLAKDKDNIDIVISNNDSMAIGAINSLKSNGFNKDKNDFANYIGVFGVDATEEAKAAIKEGSMIGTVKQDNVAMAKALYDLAKNAAAGKDYLEGTSYKYDESGIAVRIPYQKYEG